MPRILPALLAVAALLAGCGSDPARALPAPDERVPITQRAVAAIALRHLPEDTTTRRATSTDQGDPAGMLGADLRYGGDGETDGELLRVVVAPGRLDVPCEDPGCVTLDTALPGATLTLQWEEETPEEAPGIVAVILQRDDEHAYAYQSGPAVTGDPRDLELDITVDAMIALLEDPWLRLETSPDAIEAGEELDDWEGGEPDPRAQDRVPASDVALTSAYLLSRGGYLHYARPRSSPLKADFGEGAVAGRLTHDPDRWVPATTIDVLAAPQAPAWLGERPCAAPRFAGHCVQTRGRLGPVSLAWVPGTGGEVWMVGTRPDEVVAVRLSGWDVPSAQAAVEEDAEWYAHRGVLGGRRIGLTVERHVLDFDLEEIKQLS